MPPSLILLTTSALTLVVVASSHATHALLKGGDKNRSSNHNPTLKTHAHTEKEEQALLAKTEALSHKTEKPKESPERANRKETGKF